MQTKGTLPEGELESVVADSDDPTMTKQITVPVLWALGVNDNLWCGTTHNCYTSTAPTTMTVIREKVDALPDTVDEV